MGTSTDDSLEMPDLCKGSHKSMLSLFGCHRSLRMYCSVGSLVVALGIQKCLTRNTYLTVYINPSQSTPSEGDLGRYNIAITFNPSALKITIMLRVFYESVFASIF